MAATKVKTSVILWAERYAPPSMLTDQVRTLRESGVVDDVSLADQLNNFIPPFMWKAEHAPLAAVLPDLDSAADAYQMLSYAAAGSPGISVSMMTDSIRRKPAEAIQSMMTLANITEGRAMFQIGGGEQKQCRAYGHKRAEGLARMEDLFRLFHLVWDTPGPVSFEGHHTTFKNAYLGGAKQHKPKLWGLGSGPKLVDLVTSYCEGLSVATPCVWATPEQAGEHIARIKQDLVRKGRDPERFGFGIAVPMLLHEDAAVIDRALDNALVRWIAAVFGRIEPAEWRKDGLEPPVPEDWMYFLKLVPYDEKPEFVQEVLRKTTRAHAAKGFFHGTPRQVAATLQRYVDAGVTWVLPVDYLPVILPPEESHAALARSIEVCAILKGRA